MIDREKCPICDQLFRETATFPSQSSYTTGYNCRQCGSYYIERDFVDEIAGSLSRTDRGILSGVIRQGTDAGPRHLVTIRSSNYQEFIEANRHQVRKYALVDNFLLEVERRTEFMGESSKVSHGLVWTSRLFFPDLRILNMVQMLASSMAWIELEKKIEHSSKYVSFTLTYDGWARVQELHAQVGKGDQAFVAMWFDEQVKPAREIGIKPALKSMGYKPYIVDESGSNDPIDDQIIAEIRRSRLLVADFTGQRAGVYFEAGFALGLGIPVIWCCKEDHLEGKEYKLHFDTRQYPFLVWNTPEDLQEKLVNRIGALGLRLN